MCLLSKIKCKQLFFSVVSGNWKKGINNRDNPKQNSHMLFNNIRTKLTLYFCIVFVISLSVIEFTDIAGIPFTPHTGSFRQQKAEALKNLSLIADLKKERLMRWLEERRDDIKVLSENNLIKTYVSEFYTKFSQEITGGSDDKELWSKVRKERTYQDLIQHLSLVKSTYGVYEKIHVISFPQKVIIASSNENDVGKIHGFDELYLSSPVLDRTFIYLEQDPVSGFPILDISFPLKFSQKIAAVLEMHVNVDDIIGPLLHTGKGLGDSGEALLVNKDVRVITSLKHPLQDGSIATPMEYKIHAMPAELAAHGEEGIIETKDYRGKQVLAAYRHIPVTSEMGWGMVVKRDREELLAPMKKGVFFSLLSGLIGLIIIIGLTIVIARKLSRPIESMSRVAKEVAEGNFDVQAPVESSDEIGVLTVTFNSMIRRIKSWGKELEKQVGKRTEQLNAANTELTREIIERRQMGKKLQVSENRFRTMVENIPGVVYRCKVERPWRVDHISEAVLFLTGYPARDFLDGQTLNYGDLIVPEDIEEVERTVNEGVTNRRSYEIEYRIRHRDGTIRWVYEKGRAVYKDDGNPLCLDGVIIDILERKKAEEALIRSKAEFEAMFNSTPEAVVLTDTGRRIIMTNPAVKSIFGYTSDELRGKTTEILYAKKTDYEQQGRQRFNIQASLHPEPYDMEYRRKDNTIFIGETLGTKVQDAEGNTVGFTGIIRDITERKQFEEEQFRLKQRLKSQWEIVCLVDADQKTVSELVLSQIVSMTQSKYGFYGHLNDDESILVMPSWSKGVMEDCAILGKNLEFYVENSGLWGNAVRERRLLIINDYNMEFPNKKGIPEGHVPIRRLMVVPIFRHNRIVAVGAVANKGADYTEKDAEHVSTFLHSAQLIIDKRHAEEELRKHREKLIDMVEERTVDLRTINEELENEIKGRKQIEEQLKLMALFAELDPSPVLRFDRDSKVLMANQSAVEILGKGVLIEKPVTSVVPGINKFDLLACIEQGTIISHTAQIGDRRFHFTFRGLPDLGIGQIYGSDISELERAKADTIRASHLASLGELAAGVAHEINNPINSIMNYAEMLTIEEMSRGREQEIASRITGEGNRIAKIVKRIISFARESKEETDPSRIDDIIYHTLTLVEKQIENEGIKLIMNISPDLPEIIAQPQRIEQVFLNIISNARHALNQRYQEANKDKILELSGGEISVNGRQYIQITFHDHGTGMPSNIMDKILNPFFTTKSSNEGTGLGLSISDRIIRDHDGNIKIDSVKDEFTKVIIQLPVRG